MNGDQGKLSRRKMLAAAAAGAAGVGAVAFAGPMRAFVSDGDIVSGSWWASIERPLANLGQEAWQRHVGTDFVIAGEAGDAVFRLIEIAPLNSQGDRAELRRETAFMALFESQGSEAPAGNQTYSTRHSSGDFDIFFSDVDLSGERPRLNAVFN